MDNKYEYAKDFIKITLLDDDLKKIDEKNLRDLIPVNLNKIIQEIILSDQYDIFNVLIENFGIDIKILVNNLISVQFNENIHNIIKYETIEWIIFNNDTEFFTEYFDKLINNYSNSICKLMVNYDILVLLYQIIIKNNHEISVKMKNIFSKNSYTCLINKSSCFSYFVSNHEKNIYTNLEHLILLTDLYILGSDFTAGTLLNDTIFMYNNTHRLINIKYPSYHCKNLGSSIKN